MPPQNAQAGARGEESGNSVRFTTQSTSDALLLMKVVVKTSDHNSVDWHLLPCSICHKSVYGQQGWKQASKRWFYSSRPKHGASMGRPTNNVCIESQPYTPIHCADMAFKQQLRLVYLCLPLNPHAVSPTREASDASHA